MNQPFGQIPTEEDVKRLAKAGELILAINMYRQIHNVGLRKAKDAVEKLADLPRAFQQPPASISPTVLSKMNMKLFDILRMKGAYGPLPIPVAEDNGISQLLRTWAALDSLDRNATVENFSEEEHRDMLECYSRRMASLAVRTQDQEFAFLGLLALGVHGWYKPWRINVIIVSLHYDALQRIGVQPEDVFEKAAALLPEQAATGLRLFLERSPVDKSIEVMWFVAGKDADGFRYMNKGHNPKQC